MKGLVGLPVRNPRIQREIAIREAYTIDIDPSERGVYEGVWLLNQQNLIFVAKIKAIFPEEFIAI